MKKYTNCNILTEKGWLENSSFCVKDGKFHEVGIDNNHKNIIDLSGKFILPGIIDIHGDSFERSIAPRAGVHFPLESAIHENDNNLLSSGITTFYYSITDSFEKGLRSRDNAREIIDFIKSTNLKCNSYIHIRHEVANTKDIDELIGWIDDKKVDLLSINDHLPRLGDDKKLLRYKNGIQRRMVMSDEEIANFIHELQSQRPIGEEQVLSLLKSAKRVNIPIASHDDDTLEKVELSKKRGVNIAEFPMTKECIKSLIDSNIYILFGAPNLIRGKSHVGGISAYEAASENILDILCSDYHYPSLFLSPFKLVSLGINTFLEAWNKVSLNPAKAVLIGHKKGSIQNKKDADFLILNSLDGKLNNIESVFVLGQEKARYKN